jgi:hypothetical protein
MSVVINGTTGITAAAFDGAVDAADLTGTLPSSTLSTYLDPENRIINGAFGSDRWYNAVASGGTVTQSRQAFALGDTLGSNSPTYFLRQSVTGTTASSHYAITMQMIESVRSYAGQTITVLGWARRSSGSGNMAVELEQNFGTGGSPSTGVYVPGQTVTLTSSWAPFALTFSVPSISGKTLGSNNNDYLRLTFWTSAGSNYNARTNSLGLQTIGVDLWGIHIKQGTHTTSAVDLYRQPELGPELIRCQRYLEDGIMDFRTVVASGAGTFVTNYQFAATKRATPALSFPEAASASSNVSGTPTLASPASAVGTARMTVASAGAGDTFYVRPFRADSEL